LDYELFIFVDPETGDILVFDTLQDLIEAYEDSQRGRGIFKRESEG
jgi:hypothetical protein